MFRILRQVVSFIALYLQLIQGNPARKHMDRTEEKRTAAISAYPSHLAAVLGIAVLWCWNNGYVFSVLNLVSILRNSLSSSALRFEP